MQDINELFEIISFIPSALTLDDLLAEFAEKSARLLDVDGCTIFRFQPDNDTIIVLADFVSAEVDTPFGDTSHIGATYPLDHYPATKTVLREQSPLMVYIDDPAADEAQKTLLDAFHWDGVLMAPIVWRGQSLGLLSLYIDDKTRHQFSDHDLAVCRVLVNQAAMIMENARLRQEAEDGRLIAEAMQVIGLALGSELDYQRIVRNVADFAYRLVDAQFVYVAVPEDEVFQLVAVAGYSNQDLVTANLLSQTPFAGAIEEKRPVIVADIQNESATTIWQKEAENQGWRAMASTPLLSHNRLVGVLVAFADEPHAFSADDVATLMSLASQAAAAIHNAQLFAQLEAQRETLHQVSLRLVNAQEEERRRISRELHDELGQALTALKINLDVARRSLTTEMPEKLSQSVNEASLLAVQTLESARNLSLELHPAILDDLGLVSALRWEIDRYEQRTEQAVQFKADLAEATLRPELEITIYRIITEALTNVARHARANLISVRVLINNHQVLVEVEDDGVGFDAEGWFNSPGERQSLGLVGMRERAGLLGGDLEVISKSGSGTKILAQLPLGT